MTSSVWAPAGQIRSACPPYSVSTMQPADDDPPGNGVLETVQHRRGLRRATDTVGLRAHSTGIEMSEATAQLERCRPGPFGGDSLSEQHAEEEREGFVVKQLVGCGIPGE